MGGPWAPGVPPLPAQSRRGGRSLVSALGTLGDRGRGHRPVLGCGWTLHPARSPTPPAPLPPAHRQSLAEKTPRPSGPQESVTGDRLSWACQLQSCLAAPSGETEVRERRDFVTELGFAWWHRAGGQLVAGGQGILLERAAGHTSRW